jgi:hypothetical protein
MAAKSKTKPTARKAKGAARKPARQAARKAKPAARNATAAAPARKATAAAPARKATAARKTTAAGKAAAAGKAGARKATAAGNAKQKPGRSAPPAPLPLPPSTEEAFAASATSEPVAAEPEAKKGALARLTSSVGNLFARMTGKNKQNDPNRMVVLNTADIGTANPTEPAPPPEPANPTIALDTSDIVWESPNPAPEPNKTVALDAADIVWESATPPPIPAKSKKKSKAR